MIAILFLYFTFSLQKKIKYVNLYKRHRISLIKTMPYESVSSRIESSRYFQICVFPSHMRIRYTITGRLTGWLVIQPLPCNPLDEVNQAIHCQVPIFLLDGNNEHLYRKNHVRNVLSNHFSRDPPAEVN